MIPIHCRRFISLVILVWGFALLSSAPPRAADAPPSPASLERDFAAPPDSAKPWAYWWWVNGNVDEASIRHDLEQMKAKGFGGLLMFDSRGYHDEILTPPPPRMEFMSPEWRRLMRFAIAEAGRLGLQMSVNLSSNAGALGGPWPVGADAPKKLVWTSIPLQGGRHITLTSDALTSGATPQSKTVAILAVRRGAPPKAEAVQPQARSKSKTNAKSKAKSKAPAKAKAPASPPAIPALEVIDLTDQASPAGLAWDVPPGDWRLLRFGCDLVEGHPNDVDILDQSAVERYFTRMGRPLLEDAGALAGKTLTHFYSVSWEGATATWTGGFEREFETRRGYPLRPWLPVLAGLTVKTPELSKRFEADYYTTLAETFRDHCYATLQRLCHEHGIKWHSESGGPWTRTIPSFQFADQLAYLGRNDMPQGEFWWPERSIARPIAMAAHIYGRPLAAAEAFTNMQSHWSDTPAALKPCADATFADGVNQLVWHTFTASPPEFGKPGIEYFAGSHLNPNVTWFPRAGALITYLSRCQVMLRRGQPVVDVCCYTSDRNYLHWGRNKTWYAKPTLTLPEGYTFDLLTTEVLLDRLSVKDGRLVLPDGMSYAVLAVDLTDEDAPPAALRRIAELARAGATVVLGRAPKRAPGLANYPAADGQVKEAVAGLWSEAGAAPGAAALGQGKLLRGVTMEAALKTASLPPDCAGPWDYAHRRDGDADIYFLRGSGSAEVTFRVANKEPELWDPVTGARRDAVTYHPTGDGRTAVALDLPENGSVFVVFRRPAEKENINPAKPLPQGTEVAGRGKGGDILLNTWSSGVQPLGGPWQVAFVPPVGEPFKADFKTLTPWNENTNEAIKYFSGAATYAIKFNLTDAQAAGLVRLELGEVKNLAHVRLNGKDLATVWTAPWRADLTDAVRPGANDLEIEVTNTWVNRLIGDARLPEAQRRTKSNAQRPFGDLKTGPKENLKGYKADDPLQPAGLIGPVKLVFGKQTEQKIPTAP